MITAASSQMPLKHTNTGCKSAPAISKDEAQIGYKRIGSTGDEAASKWTRHSQRLKAGSAQEEQHEADEEEEEGGSMPGQLRQVLVLGRFKVGRRRHRIRFDGIT